jgi:hypothetical protein
MNKSPVWLKGLIGASLAVLTTWLGVAANLFSPEIRCCLGIDPISVCPPPPCIQKIGCFLGLDSSNQCYSPSPSPSHTSPSPLLNSQYEQCQAHFNQFECQGILTVDGKCYVGEYRHQYQGQGFLLTYQGNKCYEGQFQEGQFSGNSLLLFKDGTIYQGEFRNGKRHGQGKMIAPDGTVVYEGQWSNDKPN